MRAVLQRVSKASVEVEGAQVGAIDTGLLVLLGVGRGDSEADATWLAEKIVQLRIFEDDQGKMNRSLLDVGGQLLAVSQFTLYGDARKGRRPSFVDAMEPDEARRLYQFFCAACRARGATVAEGIFQAEMRVSLVNEGPVTIWLDSKRDD